MSEHQPILDKLRLQAIAESRARIAAYNCGDILHLNAGGYENDDDANEGKN